jgi:hypothetical protein
MAPKYPHVVVRLLGTDGNAFNLLGRVQRAMADAGVTADEIRAFTREATAGDYDHLLRTCCAWVEVT